MENVLPSSVSDIGMISRRHTRLPYKPLDRAVVFDHVPETVQFQRVHALYSVRVSFANAPIEGLKGSLEKWRDVWSFFVYLITYTSPSNIITFMRREFANNMSI